MRDKLEENWSWNWGQSYTEELKVGLTLNGKLAEMIKNRALGSLVVDVGSGRNCAIAEAILHSGAKMISVDISCNEALSSSTKQWIKFDVNDFPNTAKISTQLAVAKAAKFIGTEVCKTDDDKQVVDTFLFSEILNYIQFASVLESCAEYLKPGGTFVVINKPHYGLPDFFTQRERVDDNTEVTDLVKRLDFTIEHLQFEDLDQDGRPTGKQMMILIARKN